MPGGASAPVRPAFKPFASYPLDLDKIQRPLAVPGTTIAQARSR
jgi:hypothetical protein